jgi:hypothetical protein
MLRLKTKIVFFGEIHVFLQLRSISLYGAKWAYLQLEKSDFQEVFLQK